MKQRLTALVSIALLVSGVPLPQHAIAQVESQDTPAGAGKKVFVPRREAAWDVYGLPRLPPFLFEDDAISAIPLERAEQVPPVEGEAVVTAVPLQAEEVDWGAPWLGKRVQECVRQYLQAALYEANLYQDSKGRRRFDRIDEWGRILRAPGPEGRGGISAGPRPAGGWVNPTHFVWINFNSSDSPVGGVERYVRNCLRGRTGAGTLAVAPPPAPAWPTPRDEYSPLADPGMGLPQDEEQIAGAWEYVDEFIRGTPRAETAPAEAEQVPMARPDLKVGERAAGQEADQVPGEGEKVQPGELARDTFADEFTTPPDLSRPGEMASTAPTTTPAPAATPAAPVPAPAPTPSPATTTAAPVPAVPSAPAYRPLVCEVEKIEAARRTKTSVFWTWRYGVTFAVRNNSANDITVSDANVTEQLWYTYWNAKLGRNEWRGLWADDPPRKGRGKTMWRGDKTIGAGESLRFSCVVDVPDGIGRGRCIIRAAGSHPFTCDTGEMSYP